ncbi:MAG: cytochrome c oxidase subunit II [Saccharolobus sp.]|uniref:cytochrome c oxidase subunit II n=1 Tax=Saccharolobus sp. TaxID=2100761 RepID=UPI00316A510B
MEKARIFELSTIVFAIVILTVLGVFSDIYLNSINSGAYLPTVDKENAIPIKVIGMQYAWEFVYPNGTTLIDKLVLKANQTYLLEITSKDVIHAFYIPQLGFKFEAIPGYVYDFYIVINKPGVYDIWCAEFCGPGHYLMKGTLIVVG